jgi:hypothetical protein
MHCMNSLHVVTRWEHVGIRPRWLWEWVHLMHLPVEPDLLMRLQLLYLQVKCCLAGKYSVNHLLSCWGLNLRQGMEKNFQIEWGADRALGSMSKCVLPAHTHCCYCTCEWNLRMNRTRCNFLAKRLSGTRTPHFHKLGFGDHIMNMLFSYQILFGQRVNFNNHFVV